MIQVNELRVGNWVSLNKGLTMVTKINPDNFSSYWANKFYPIPLTEEILLKCARHTGSGFFRFDKMIEYSLTACELWIQYLDEPITHIKHLHQLQNLYFALTGTELKIEL